MAAGYDAVSWLARAASVIVIAIVVEVGSSLPTNGQTPGPSAPPGIDCSPTARGGETWSLETSAPGVPAGSPQPSPASEAADAWTVVQGAGADGEACTIDRLLSWARGFAGVTFTKRATIAFWESSDGLNWLRTPGVRVAGLTEIPELVAWQDGLVMISANRGRIVLWHSTDGQSWRRLRGSPELRSGGQYTTVIGASSSHERLTVWGAAVRPGPQLGCDAASCPNTPLVWVGRSLTEWSRHLQQPDARRFLVYGHEPFIGATGFLRLSRRPGVIEQSVFGSKWIAAGIVPTGVGSDLFLGYRAADDSTYLVASVPESPETGNRAVEVFRSSDLYSWAPVYKTDYIWGDLPVAVAISDDGIVVTGASAADEARFLSSHDGSSWRVAGASEPGCPGVDAVRVGAAVAAARAPGCAGPSIWRASLG